MGASVAALAAAAVGACRLSGGRLAWRSAESSVHPAPRHHACLSPQGTGGRDVPASRSPGARHRPAELARGVLAAGGGARIRSGYWLMSCFDSRRLSSTPSASLPAAGASAIAVFISLAASGNLPSAL